MVATHFGFHILKATERKDPEPLPFEELRETLAEQYLTNRRETLINELVADLKAKGTIEEIEEPVEA